MDTTTLRKLAILLLDDPHGLNRLAADTYDVATKASYAKAIEARIAWDTAKNDAAYAIAYDKTAESTQIAITAEIVAARAAAYAYMYAYDVRVAAEVFKEKA